MKTKNMIAIRVLVVVMGFPVVLPLIAEARTLKLACGGQRTITAVVEKLNPGDTLLIEGSCVENVLIPEQVADVIKKRGGIVEFKIYENEGHGFARVENQIDAYTRVAEFLKKHVPAPPCGCTL